VFNAVGGKAALLKAAYDVATVGDDEPVPLPQRPAAVATRLESDPRRRSRSTRHDRRHRRALAPIYEVFRAASLSDPRSARSGRRSNGSG
jgi:hypothetical protein